MGTALNRRTMLSLAKAIAAEDFSSLERLFLAAKARPPLVVWQPDQAMLRSPVLAGLLRSWQHASSARGALPTMAEAWALARGRHSEWTMLLVPTDTGPAPPPGSPAPPEPLAAAAIAPLDRLVYRHYGAGIARHYGRDMTGRTMAAFPGHIGSFFAAVYEAARLRPEPIFTEHEPPAAVLVRSWRRLILPFADPGEPVTGFVVGNIPESAVGTLLDVMYDAALVTDGEGRIRLANRAAAELLGNAGPPLMGSELDAHLPGLTKVMRRLAGEVDGVGALGRHEIVLGRGRRRHVIDVSIGGTRVAGAPLFVLVLRDLTERAEREHALESIAFRDELTGVLNRRGLLQRIAAEDRPGQQRTRRRGDGFGLVIVDLDDFKSLNDTHGHATGDAVLASVAHRLAGALRGVDSVARWGGDEFVLVLHGIGSPTDLEPALAKLLDAVAQPHIVGGKPLLASTSLGAALFPANGDSFDAVLAAADKALYVAKSRGGNSVELAPPGITSAGD